MLRQFSDSPVLNPRGWRGHNWRGLGFDLYAYFPEFAPSEIQSSAGDPGQTERRGTPGPGSGNFRVDYQDTLRDFQRFTLRHRPCAIVTFSRGAPSPGWEIETGARNRDTWVPDFEAPYLPTPNPPDSSLAPNAFRPSTLPMEAIEAAVTNAGLGLPVWIDHSGEVGAFLSEYIAYLGIWYQERHSRPGDKWRCVAAGHIHVGSLTHPEMAVKAVEFTLEEVIRTVRQRL